MSTENNLKTFSMLREHCAYLDVINDAALGSLVKSSHELVVEAGEHVLFANQILDYAHIVLQGSVATVFERDWGEDRVLEEIACGELLAEAELLSADKCHSDIRALEETCLLCIPRHVFTTLVAEHASLWQYLSEKGRSKTSLLYVTKYLSDLFGSVKNKIADPLLRLQTEEEWLNFECEILENIGDSIEWLTLKRGDYLFRQGERTNGASIIVSGTLRVLIDQENDTSLEVERLKQGDIVGELALIDAGNRSVSVEALRECELFRLPPKLLAHVAEKYPRAMLNMYRTISKQFQKTVHNKSYRPTKSNVAIIPMINNAVLEDFIEQLYSSMSNLASVEYLDSDSVDKQLGFTGIANISRSEPASTGLVHWLNSKELISEYLLFRADHSWSQWSNRCVNQSDELIILVDATTAIPDFSKFKSRIEASNRTWKMVMLHPEKTLRPRDSAMWKLASGARAIYHARNHNADDIDRVARILTGKAIGLVLGGGGARGFAHIGAFRALEEMDVKVDMVGGTSIGAPLAALIAQGHDSKECHKLVKEGFSDVFDITLPVTSIIQGKKISRSINKQGEEWDIEDLWLPFFCVSSNLTTARQVVHQTGNVARAVRASVSIPGLLPPIVEDGEYLVDGAVLNNIPIDIMRSLNPSGTVLAIDVIAPNYSRAEKDHGLSLSGWRQLYRRLNPLKRPYRVPSIATILMQSMTLGSGLLRTQILRQGLADFYQNIHVKGVGLLEFNAVDRAIEIGYKSYLGPLQVWLKSSDDATNE